MKKVVILGGRGTGIIAASIAQETGIEVIGMLNDRLEVGETQGKFTQFKVLGKINEVHKFIQDENVYAFIAFKTMKKEKEMWELLQSLQIPSKKFINLIHPSAKLNPDYCKLGNGILMAPNAQLSADTTIGDNCMILGNAFIGHDAILEPYVTVTNNASIGARVHIGTAAHIGSNATVRQGVKLGDFSLVGMHSLVLQDVPEGQIVVGVPAKPM